MTYFQLVVTVLKKASLVGAFFMAAQPFALALDSHCMPPQKAVAYSIQRVVDGDTLRLKDGRSVRLIGINTPELGGYGRTAEPYAEQAKHRLVRLVQANEGKLWLQLGEQEHDRYGRVLAYVYDRHGVSLAAQLLAEGLAYHVVVEPNVAAAECLSRVEKRAQQAALGVWKTPRYLSVSQVKQGGFTLLHGRIEAVRRTRSGVWLELGQSLALYIPKQAIGYFSDQSFERWQGRGIKVRGWLSEQRGGDKSFSRWRLTLSHPSMLELESQKEPKN